MKISTIFSGLAGVLVIVLIAVGVLCGGFIRFDNLSLTVNGGIGFEAAYKKHTVTWCYNDAETGTTVVMEEDKGLDTNDIAYFDRYDMIPEGYKIVSFSNGAKQDEKSDIWYVSVGASNISCYAELVALENQVVEAGF